MDKITGILMWQHFKSQTITPSYFTRIKMCTGVNHKDLITVHHEMAHIQYFLSYRNKPKVFRDGANAGKFLAHFSGDVFLHNDNQTCL